MTLRVAGLRLFYAVLLGWLFLPLGLMAAMSLKDSDFVGFPIRRLTPRWYGAMLGDPEILRAGLVSVGVAVASAALAVGVGLWIALALARVGRWRLLLGCAACFPLVTPGIVAAIAMRMFIRLLGIDPGPVATILGHAVHATPVAVLLIAARLRGLPREMTEAARDLGAGEMRLFRRIVLPHVGPAMAGAGLLALLESLDDFVRSFFLSGYQPTLPVLIYARLHSGLSPEINAVATALLAVTMAMGLAGERRLLR